MKTLPLPRHGITLTFDRDFPAFIHRAIFFSLTRCKGSIYLLSHCVALSFRNGGAFCFVLIFNALTARQKNI